MVPSGASGRQSSGRAGATLESIIVQEIGGETKYQELPTTPKDDSWNILWEKFEAKLKMAAWLDASSELNEAVEDYGKVILHRNATIPQLEEFVQSYSTARIRMIENGLLADGDQA